jgi:deoxyribonuclease V
MGEPVRCSSPIHPFDVTCREAKRIQEELSGRVDLSDRIASIDEIELVGGADVAFLPVSADSSECIRAAAGGISSDTEPGGGDSPSPSWRRFVALAAVVLIDVRRGEIVETSYAVAPVRFPYVPGYLTFREGPAVLAAIGELDTLPGVMLYDGAGIAHPRGMGIASHMAVMTGIPSIGCAKSLLVGECGEPGIERGGRTPIEMNGRRIGICLRTRRGVKPVFVSPGSGFSIDGAARFVLALGGAYRLPEPTRLAHHLVTERKRLMTGMGADTGDSGISLSRFRV